MKLQSSAMTMLLAAMLLLPGCAQIARRSSDAPEAVHQTIDAKAAFTMMQDSDEYILLDVRTPEEYSVSHIEGALLLPDYELEVRAEEALPDKDARILVYCRSGRRSAASAATLAGMGYTQVYDFGGIIDWSYGTVTGE
jgi:phage shock protein E